MDEHVVLMMEKALVDELIAFCQREDILPTKADELTERLADITGYYKEVVEALI